MRRFYLLPLCLVGLLVLLWFLIPTAAVSITKAIRSQEANQRSIQHQVGRSRLVSPLPATQSSKSQNLAAIPSAGLVSKIDSVPKKIISPDSSGKMFQAKPGDWPTDAYGRLVLLTPHGPKNEDRNFDSSSGCSLSFFGKLQKEFGNIDGMKVDVRRPLPPGSVPPSPPVIETAPSRQKGSIILSNKGHNTLKLALNKFQMPQSLLGGTLLNSHNSPPGPMASISSSDVNGLSGPPFVNTVLTSDDLDSSFFDPSNPDTKTALAPARIQEIVDELNVLLASPLTNSSKIERGLYFLRAAAYCFGNDPFNYNYSFQLRANIRDLLISIGNHPQFLDPGFLAPRLEWSVDIDSWVSMSYVVNRITQLLERFYNTPSLHTDYDESSCIYNLLSGIARTSPFDFQWAGKYSSNFMAALEDYAVNLVDNPDTDFAVTNAIYALGHLYAQDPVSAYQGQAHQILTSAYYSRPVDQAPYLEVLMAIELYPFNSRLADGTFIDINAHRQQLAAQIFSNTFSYDDGTMIFHTPLSAQKISDLYDALHEVKAQFFRLTQALNPADNDNNSVLTTRIYATPDDYDLYQRFLYGLPTDNGGMYIEVGATFYTYERTPQQSIYTLEELSRHEYVHYLDGYYLLTPQFGDILWYSNDRLTWHSEGLAEFLDGSRRTEDIMVRERMIKKMGANPMPISQIIGATYDSGFGFYSNAALFFQFLYEEHPDKLWEYFNILYQNNISAYDSLTQGWRFNNTLQQQYTSYLNQVKTAVNNGSRLSAEDIPTDYKPALLTSSTLTQIEGQIENVLPPGIITGSDNRFHFQADHFMTVPGATTIEAFQDALDGYLDQSLETLTPVDAHFQVTTGWYKIISISQNTAFAKLYLDSWYKPTQYDQWAQTVFPAGTPAAEQLPMADFDNNGVPNLIEFAFGITPGGSDQQPLMPHSGKMNQASQDYLTISFRRRTSNPSGANYSVLQSTDLVQWTELDIPTQQVGIPMDNGDGTETVTVRSDKPISGNGAAKNLFLRVKVENTGE